MKRNSQNLQHHLLARESNVYPGRRHPVPSHFLFHERNFYKSITPRLTVQNVDKPHGYYRKFSPNGKYLIAFTVDQRALDVYEYLGIGSAASLISQIQDECITAYDHSESSLRVRQQLFDSIFKKLHHMHIIKLPGSTKHFLNREFSLFLDHGNYLLLASMAGGSIFPNYSEQELFTEVYDDTELYDYTFYLIDLRRGCVVDTVKLESDFIVLSHHHSVSVFGNTVAILSTYRQCIDIYLLDSELGKLQQLYIIGPFLNDLDKDTVLGHEREINFVLDPGRPVPLTQLKQKILAFMYREIMEIQAPSDRHQRLKEFYRNYIRYEEMTIVKMQLVDDHNILIRYEKRKWPIQLINVKYFDTVINNCFKTYVFYDMSTHAVLRVFKEDSPELLRMLRNYGDGFRNSQSLQIPWHSSSPSNNCFFRKAFERAICSFPGGLLEAATRFNPTVPISSQSFSTSPYLDYSLFYYDDRHISTLERPRHNSNEPIRFTDRETGLLKFRVFLEQSNYAQHPVCINLSSRKDLVSYIFHPYEPFFISKQKLSARYVLNFHLYSPSIIPKE